MQTGCSAPGNVVESQSVEEAGVHLPGKFVWHDLMTDDVAAARSFYGPLFGWSFEQNDRFTAIRRNERRIGSIVEVIDESGQPQVARWIGSLSVPDVDRAAALVASSGGKVHEDPSEMRNRGRVAFVSDPHGAQLVLVRNANGDPQDGIGRDPGDWLWDELWTDDPDDSVRFYMDLAGYSATEDIDGYRVLKSGDRWRAGVRTLFERDLEQRWVPVIKVASTEQVSEKAIGLGGRVILLTEDSGDGDAAALLADPSGALFIVQEWQGMEQAAEDTVQ